MIKVAPLAVLAFAALLSACVTPRMSGQAPRIPDLAAEPGLPANGALPDRLTDNAPVHSWFYLAPRPITSFEWRANRIVLKSIDPQGVEQVRIELTGIAAYNTRVVAGAKNLEALGGGAPMVYVRAYVDDCARA